MLLAQRAKNATTVRADATASFWLDPLLGTGKMRRKATDRGQAFGHFHRLILACIGSGGFALQFFEGQLKPLKLDRQFLRRLAKGHVAQLGELGAQRIDKSIAVRLDGFQLGNFENEMVTYRVKAGKGRKRLFTKIGVQLEAYCSAVGKVLLAYLLGTDEKAHLATGPFPTLTERK